MHFWVFHCVIALSIQISSVSFPVSQLSQFLLSIRDWAETFNAGFQTDVVYIDFQKAFDTVSLNKLLFKLSSYGVCAPLLSWVRTFLVDTFSVRVSDSYSLPRKVISGIP